MAKLENVTVKGRRNTPEPTSAAPPPKLKITKPGLANHLKIVLFGPPKTGKTTASCTGSGRKLLILTEPDGDLPLIGREDIDVVRPTTAKELYDIILALHAGEVYNYEWVILDSVTFAFEMVGRQQIAKAIADNVDIRRPYGQVGAALSQMLYDLVALPTNVVFITQLRHDQQDDDEAGPEEGKFPVSLAVTPLVYKILAPAVSVLGRTYKQMFVDAKGNKVVQFLVSFEDYGRSPAGARIPVENVVENLQLDTLVEHLKGVTK